MRKEEKFPCLVFQIRKWVHRRCSGIKVRLKQEDEFIYKTSISKGTDTAGECCATLGQLKNIM